MTIKRSSTKTVIRGRIPFFRKKVTVPDERILEPGYAEIVRYKTYDDGYFEGDAVFTVLSPDVVRYDVLRDRTLQSRENPDSLEFTFPPDYPRFNQGDVGIIERIEHEGEEINTQFPAVYSRHKDQIFDLKSGNEITVTWEPTLPTQARK